MGVESKLLPGAKLLLVVSCRVNPRNDDETKTGIAAQKLQHNFNDFLGSDFVLFTLTNLNQFLLLDQRPG